MLHAGCILILFRSAREMNIAMACKTSNYLMVLIRAKKGKKIIIPKLAMWDNVSDHAEGLYSNTSTQFRR